MFLVFFSSLWNLIYSATNQDGDIEILENWLQSIHLHQIMSYKVLRTKISIIDNYMICISFIF